jgi:hypothetical protein
VAAVVAGGVPWEERLYFAERDVGLERSERRRNGVGQVYLSVGAARIHRKRLALKSHRR